MSGYPIGCRKWIRLTLTKGAERHVAAGIDFDKYDDIPVESSGNGIPGECLWVG